MGKTASVDIPYTLTTYTPSVEKPQFPYSDIEGFDATQGTDGTIDYKQEYQITLSGLLDGSQVK